MKAPALRHPYDEGVRCDAVTGPGCWARRLTLARKFHLTGIQMKRMLVDMGPATRSYDMSVRGARMAATRQRLLEAAISGFGERRYDDVTLNELADAAGVSVQTLLNHFGSKEGMLEAAMALFAETVRDVRGEVEPGNVDAAVTRLLTQYEPMGDANWRTVADADRQPLLARVLIDARAHHRAWIEEVFGAELSADAQTRETQLSALYAATDVGTWKLLRRDLGCSVEQTHATMTRLVRGALASTSTSESADADAAQPAPPERTGGFS